MDWMVKVNLDGKNELLEEKVIIKNNKKYISKILFGKILISLTSFNVLIHVLVE